MGFKLKKVENEQQIAAMCQVAGQVWHLTYDPLLPPGQVDYMVEKFQSPHAVAEQMERERYQYHTLEEDGRVMGFVGFSPRYEGREEMFLSKVYLLPEARGRGGVRMAFELVEREARRLGLELVRLTVNKHNTHAADIYRHYGYVVTDSVTTDIGHGYVMDDYIMVKKLPPLTPRERMLAGLLYDPGDPELTAMRRRARGLTYRFNNLPPDAFDEMAGILQELLGEMGEDSWLAQPLRVDYGCHLRLGKGASANYNLTVLDCAAVTIGDHVLIGPNCTLAAPMHPLLAEQRSQVDITTGQVVQPEYALPITIEDNCWLAANVTVCGGVTIGEGSVIGAGSVVTRDVPPRSLAAGVPCRVIRGLTEEDRMAQP